MARLNLNSWKGDNGDSGGCGGGDDDNIVINYLIKTPKTNNNSHMFRSVSPLKQVWDTHARTCTHTETILQSAYLDPLQ